MTIKIERAKPVISREKKEIERRNVEIERIPDLNTMFVDDGDPLENVDYDQNDIETSANNEMSEILRLIIEKRKTDAERFRITFDTDYYIEICFQSVDQKKKFLELTGWAHPEDKYINGLEVARKLNLPIEPIKLEPIPLRGKPKKYTREEVI